MSLIGQYLRQHTVEFIPGVGMVFDGTRTDATSLNGPWTWQTPDGALQGEIDGCGGGGGGGGGSNSTTTAGGGGGGGSAMSIAGVQIAWAKGAILTITAGAGGVGGAENANGTSGGLTTISGLLPNHYAALSFAGASGTMQINSGRNGSFGTAAGGNGGLGAAGQGSAQGLGGLGTGGASAATPGNGNAGTEYVQSYFGIMYTFGGCGGGGSSTTATTAGGSGNWWQSNGGRFLVTGLGYAGNTAGGENGTVSWGGGGGGGPSLFGLPGVGGSALAAAGANATGFGAGGGGGAGNGAGGNGSPGYVKITYWSAN